MPTAQLQLLWLGGASYACGFQFLLGLAAVFAANVASVLKNHCL
jgi:hypothetical protein